MAIWDQPRRIHDGFTSIGRGNGMRCKPRRNHLVIPPPLPAKRNLAVQKVTQVPTIIPTQTQTHTRTRASTLTSPRRDYLIREGSMYLACLIFGLAFRSKKCGRASARRSRVVFLGFYYGQVTFREEQRKRKKYPEPPSGWTEIPFPTLLPWVSIIAATD